MKMHPQKSSFIKIAESHGISLEIAESLFDALSQEHNSVSNSKFTQILLYLSMLIIILFLHLWIINNWELLSGFRDALLGTMYMPILGFLGYRLWKHQKLRVLGGLLITAAVFLTPLAVNLGSENVFFMEIATLIVGFAALYFVRFPFITFPIAFTLWKMSMDLTALVFGQTLNATQANAVSILIGLHMLLIGFFIDKRTKEDYSFWMYLYGLTAFWIGFMTLIPEKSEISLLLWCCTNLGLIILSLLLQRKIFIIFGFFGLVFYLVLQANAFENGFLHTIAVLVFTLFWFYLWLPNLYDQQIKKMDSFLIRILPDYFKKHLPRYRENKNL